MLFIIIGIICILIEEHFPNNPFNDYIKTFATVCLISAPLSIIFCYYSGMSISNILNKVIPVSEKCEEYGLISIGKDFQLNEEKMQTAFIYSKIFYLIMNDGKVFISGNLGLFNERLKTEN